MFFDRPTHRYFSLLEALGQAAIATDASGLIVYWNEAAEDLYGFPREEAIGRNVLEGPPAAVSRTQAAEIMQTLANGEVWSGDFLVQARSGETFAASVTDIPLNPD